MKRLFLLCSLPIFATQIWAAPVCVTGAMSTYDASGFSCSLGDFTFSGFGFSAVGTTMPLPTPDAVLVTPISDGSSTGLSFQGPFGAGAGQALDVSIFFVVTSATPIIGGDSLAIQGFGASGGGAVQVTESMCEGAVPPASGVCSGTTGSLDVFDNAGGIKAFDSITFAPVSTLAVSKDIMITGGGPGTPSSAGDSLVINTTPESTGRTAGTPEPSTLLLLGGGLLSARLFKRRRLIS